MRNFYFINKINKKNFQNIYIKIFFINYTKTIKQSLSKLFEILNRFTIKKKNNYVTIHLAELQWIYMCDKYDDK